MQLTNITADNLVVDAFNPRRTHDEKTIETLAKSIGANGVLVPLIVRPESLGEGVQSFRYKVLAGSRRLAAGKRAEVAEFPCVVRNITDTEAAELALVEQDNHETLHYLELAEGLLRWREAGATVEEMAEKIQRKRATVYSVLGLAKLTPEAKRACWDKKLEEVAARELATYPAKVQGQALKEMLSQGDDGKPRSAREMIELLRSKWRLDLKRSGFDPADTTLESKECGSPVCGACPHRTGNAPELFEGDVDPDLCTNRIGYEARQEARWKQQVDDGEHSRGPRCLPDAEAKKVLTDRGNVLDVQRFVDAGFPCHEDSKQRTYRELLGPAPEKHLVLARAPGSKKVVELVPRAGLTKLLDEVGIIKRRVERAPVADEKLSKEEKKAIEKKQGRRDDVTKRAITAIVAKVEKRGADKKLLRLLADALVHQGALEMTWERRDVQEPPARYLDRLSEAQLLGFVVEGALEFELYGRDGDYAERLVEMAKIYAVDLKELEREVVAEEKAKPTVKKGKAK